MAKRYRHTLPVRLAHWANVLCLPILLLSGFQIFNAHPALYWGERSDRDRPILQMSSMRTDTGELKGITNILGYRFNTTGVFGSSIDQSGTARSRGFPSWATLPSGQWLAMGRRWHLFFAWVFVINGVFFALYALVSRHLARDLVPHWNDLRGIPRMILNHLRVHHLQGEDAARYNVLQRLAYTGVIFGLGPLIVLTGMAMSPALDTAFPWLLTIFDGRQSARTIHFVAAFTFIAYTAVHVLMVGVSGLRNNLRGMVTGWYHTRD